MFACDYCRIAEYKIDSIETEIIQIILANFKMYNVLYYTPGRGKIVRHNIIK